MTSVSPPAYRTQVSGQKKSPRPIQINHLDNHHVYKMSIDKSQTTAKFGGPKTSSETFRQPRGKCPSHNNNKHTRGDSDDTDDAHERFECKVCHKKYGSTGHLRRHIKSHNPPTIPCPIEGCTFKFSRADSMRSHHANHLKNLDNPSYKLSQQRQHSKPKTIPRKQEVPNEPTATNEDRLVQATMIPVSMIIPQPTAISIEQILTNLNPQSISQPISPPANLLQIINLQNRLMEQERQLLEQLESLPIRR
jgi:hypothetical protein